MVLVPPWTSRNDKHPTYMLLSEHSTHVLHMHAFDLGSHTVASACDSKESVEMLQIHMPVARRLLV